MKRVNAMVTALVNLAEGVGHALRWLSPTLARLTVGLVFFKSG